MTKITILVSLTKYVGDKTLYDHVVEGMKYEI